ncbi:MAG: glutathione S-transferase family protein [Gammaproteobacteria bacterium]
MKLYTYEESGNSYKVRLLMSLLGIECEKIDIDLMQDIQHQPEFLAINPRGEVPVLIDGDLTLRDSSAILVYLANMHGGAPWWSGDAAEQGAIMEWLAFAASWVQYGVFTARAIVSFGISGNGIPHDYSEDLEPSKIRGQRSLEILNEHLASREWLACGRPTIDDIAVFPYVALAPMGNISLEPYASVQAWIERIKSLPRFIPIAGLDDADYRK